VAWENILPPGGYVTKSSPPEVLLRAIHDVYAGHRFLSADIAQALAL